MKTIFSLISILFILFCSCKKTENLPFAWVKDRNQLVYNTYTLQKTIINGATLIIYKSRNIDKTNKKIITTYKLASKNF